MAKSSFLTQGTIVQVRTPDTVFTGKFISESEDGTVVLAALNEEKYMRIPGREIQLITW